LSKERLIRLGVALYPVGYRGGRGGGHIGEDVTAVVFDVLYPRACKRVS
jgi:hypothetical protein